MLQIHDLPAAELNRLRLACAYLFSPDHTKDDQFLMNLKFDLVKQAFAEKAKRYHPDLHGNDSPEIIEKRKERFIKIRESYETLRDYMTKEPIAAPAFKPLRRRTVVAVGGAKGGIGKSIFSANLGVFLSRMGKKTVLVDLDLGGANLHLYVGETCLPYTLHDFLSQKIGRLEQTMVTTKFGPKLIGGDGSRLGAANIDPSMKLKLMKSIRMIDADYVVLDLGGDTSYNMIDFFLSADQGLVLTTCDPTSYLEAYNFIKVSLFRKLNRLFSEGINTGVEKNFLLKGLIEGLTLSRNGSGIKTIDQLLERIKKEQPQYHLLVKGIISKFRPYLIINMKESETDASVVVRRIQEVARKMLSIEVGYLGSLPFQPEIKASARELVPAIAKFPKGYLSATMANLVEKMIYGTPRRDQAQ
jgi:flagellar biosynthesis protein FlhG